MAFLDDDLAIYSPKHIPIEIEPDGLIPSQYISEFRKHHSCKMIVHSCYVGDVNLTKFGADCVIYSLSDINDFYNKCIQYYHHNKLEIFEFIMLKNMI